MRSSRPKIAFFGVQLESNSFAPPTTRNDFRLLFGNEILEEASKPSPAMPKEILGFMEEMSGLGEWEPVPILIAAAPPGSPFCGFLFWGFTQWPGPDVLQFLTSPGFATTAF